MSFEFSITPFLDKIINYFYQDTLTQTSIKKTNKQNKSTASKIPHGNSYLTRKLLSIVISLDKLSDDGDSKNANIIIKNMFNIKKLVIK
jgi:hypothetical protein